MKVRLRSYEYLQEKHFVLFSDFFAKEEREGKSMFK